MLQHLVWLRDGTEQERERAVRALARFVDDDWAEVLI